MPAAIRASSSDAPKAMRTGIGDEEIFGFIAFCSDFLVNLSWLGAIARRIAPLPYILQRAAIFTREASNYFLSSARRSFSAADLAFGLCRGPRQFSIAASAHKGGFEKRALIGWQARQAFPHPLAGRTQIFRVRRGGPSEAALPFVALKLLRRVW
jgi:hypothetical protein